MSTNLPPCGSIATAGSTDSSTASTDTEIMSPTIAECSAANISIRGLGDVLAHETDADDEELIPVAKAKTIAFADDDASVDSDYSGDQKPPARNEPEQVHSATSFKYKPVHHTQDKAQDHVASSSSSSLRKRPPKLGEKKLGFVSQMYDMDQKGYLTEEELLMREMDVEGRGYLTKEQVYEIVKQKLDEEYDIKQYKMMSCWMMGFMVLLAICGFGTSYTSAILSKETNADVESGAVLVKNTGKVVGFDSIGDTLGFSELSDAEYTERKLTVLAEMAEDEFNEEHAHRKLASTRAATTILFDQGKCSEKDLEKIVVKCDAGNVVNIERTWKNADGTKDTDYDTICGPDFTVVSKKGPRKKSSGKSKNTGGIKVRTTMQQIVFKKGPRKGKNSGDDDGDMVSFSCNKGWCYASGTLLQQSEGHPCSIQRGHEECRDGLICYAGESITYGTGVCTKFAKNRKPGQFCDISYGLNACTDGSVCEGNLKSGTVYVEEPSGKVLGMGICSSALLTMRAKFGDMCDASYGNDACLDGLVCMDLKGKAILGKKGMGVCGQKVVREVNYKGARWYVDYDLGTNREGRCVRDCPVGAFNNCGGNAANYDEYFGSASECCEHKLWWVNKASCVIDWPVLE